MKAAAAALALALAAPCWAAPPVVTKVEPPSWWPGHSMNPVRLLIRGQGLAGAEVQGTAGLSVGEGLANVQGTALFVDVTIDPAAAPGVRRLSVVTADGRAEAVFELLAPLPRAGRFQGFSPDDVIYLLMPDRFSNGDAGNDEPAVSRGLLDRARPRYYHGGDLQGVIDRLPYLADLGITALWINPFYDNVNHLNERQSVDGQAVTDYHGYGATDLYAVEERLGDVAKLRELVDAAHRSGIKVIQDQVANHVGPDHPWADDPPTPNWLNGTRAQHLENRWQTWTLMDPHSPPALRKETLDGWFVNVLPDLNQDDPEAARYLIQNSLWWVGVTGLDGIRQDTLPYVPRAFWRDWTAALAREYPQLTVVGELFDGNPALVSFFQGGVSRFDGIDTGVHALFDFPLYYAVRRVFAGDAPMRDLAVALGHDHLYPRPELLVTFLGLHDVARYANQPKASPDALRAAFTFLFTTRGIPLVYYGDEVGMPGGEDPDNRRDFPGGFPGDPRDAFTAAGRTPAEQGVFEHVRALARLRKNLPALRRGRLVNLLVEEHAYVFARVHEEGTVVVAFNATDAPLEKDFLAASVSLRPHRPLRDALGTGATALVDMMFGGGRLHLEVPAHTAAVFVSPP
jgi:glycosidase